MKKLLITGAGGFLGKRAAAYYQDRYDVTACKHADLDIADPEDVRRVFDRVQPDFVLHCAAISNTGYAQEHPDESLLINLEGTLNIARACVSVGAKLVYMSSDQVYTGCTGSQALTEALELAPINVYGQHKLESEKQVCRIAPDAVGLRLTWMYDVPGSAHGDKPGLLTNLKAAAESGARIRGATGEYRAMTYVWDVVKRLEQCFTLPGGSYNFGASNTRNTYDTLCAVAQAMGYDAAAVVEADNAFARNILIDNTKLHRAGIHFPDTVEGAKQALAGA